MNLERLERVHTDKQVEQLLLPPDSETVFLPTARLVVPSLAPQQVFESFVQIANRIVEAYQSDLYYDAEKLKEQDWEKEVTLWYAVGDCGTNLYEAMAPAQAMRKHGRPHVYQVIYRKSVKLNKYFTLTIRKIHSPEEK